MEKQMIQRIFRWTLIFCVFQSVRGNRVLELSDRFLEVRSNGVWLVMFYAPWCGHCKNLEPIWNQVAQSLVDTDIRVGRIDCTRFTSVATEFSVQGFPTILFIRGHKTTEYNGDRERTEIVDFARRMNGPPIRHFASCENFRALREEKKVFFAYVEDATMKENVILHDNFTRAAADFQTVLSFYTIPVSCVVQESGLAVPTQPTVFVFKDNSCYPFDAETNITLYEWINRERFPGFLKITNGNFYQLMRTGKYIVMAVLEENQIGGLTLKMSEFRDVVEAIAINNKDIYHEQFVFGWLSKPDIANNIAIQMLPIPSLIVVNSTTSQHYLPPTEEINEKVPSPQTILMLLDLIKKGRVIPLGGETNYYKIKRGLFGIGVSLTTMWEGNPVLTTVLLGLPIGLFAVICYTTCCSDILEANEEEEEEEEPETVDERHQKRE